MVSHGMKHSIIILPVHHGNPLFQAGALHKKLPNASRVKHLCVLLGDGFRGQNIPSLCTKPEPLQAPVCFPSGVRQKLKLLKAWMRRAVGARDASDQPPVPQPDRGPLGKVVCSLQSFLKEIKIY